MKMDRRFDEKSLSIIHALVALDPSNEFFLNNSFLKPLISLMRINISEEEKLKMQIQVSKPFILMDEKQESTLFGFLQAIIRMLMPYKTEFPLSFMHAPDIWSVCSTERTF